MGRPSEGFDHCNKITFVRGHFVSSDFTGLRYSPTRQHLMAEFCEEWAGTMMADTHVNGRYDNRETTQCEFVCNDIDRFKSGDIGRAVALAQKLIEQGVLTYDHFMRVGEEPWDYKARMALSGRNAPALQPEPYSLRSLEVLARDHLPATQQQTVSHQGFFTRLLSGMHLR